MTQLTLRLQRPHWRPSTGFPGTMQAAHDANLGGVPCAERASRVWLAQACMPLPAAHHTRTLRKHHFLVLQSKDRTALGVSQL